VYAGIGGLGVLLVIGSIAVELFFHKGTRREPPTPVGMLECNLGVRRLLEGLGDEAALLQRASARGEDVDLAAEWDRFARDWQADWDDLNTRCAFDELADTGRVSLAYGRMAWVHRRLVTVKLEFTEMMARFSKDLEPELAEMREALDKSLADLPPLPESDAGPPSGAEKR
jgi:hypothetical protein